MPNQRSPGQKLIAFPLDNELADAMDKARGVMNRSQFIREALAEKLKMPLKLTAAPDRVKVKTVAEGDAGPHGVNDSDAKSPKVRTPVTYPKPPHKKKS